MIVSIFPVRSLWEFFTLNPEELEKEMCAVNKIFGFVVSSLLVVILFSCQNNAQSISVPAPLHTIVVTRIADQTFEVTRLVPPLAPEKDALIPTSTSTSTVVSPSLQIRTDDSLVEVPPTYFDGFIVLTQYYTLLDNELYEDAVSLYSSSILKKNGFDAEVEHFQYDLSAVSIRFIYPFDYWLALQGEEASSKRDGKIRYVVGTTVFHKAAAWHTGGTPMPDEQTHFISLIMENNEWKIDQFNTSPWFLDP
ncbi:MAG: hypothetical protein ACOYYS_13840 [Chloroflexota bacterium]